MCPNSTQIAASPRQLRLAAFVFSLILVGVAAVPDTHAADPRGRASVLTTVSPGYTRTQLPDGTFQAETFAFGNGGCTARALRDDSIDPLPFIAVAAELIEPLARRGYISSKDPSKTQLLIMVHWGRTESPDDIGGFVSGSGRIASTPVAFPGLTMPAGFSAEDGAAPNLAASSSYGDFDSMIIDVNNRQRGRIQQRNALILGYSEKLKDVNIMAANVGICDAYTEITTEIDDSRYFVVLVAYDFQKAWKQKTLEVQWTTRFSLRARGNRFDQQLPVMAQYASRYFGRDSGGLVRSYLPSNGTVTIGPSEVLGEE